jgi:DNA polymerase V
MVGARIVMELRGLSYLPLEICPRPRKSVTISRSFPQEIESLDEIKEAISTFVTRAAEKMRKSKLSARDHTAFELDYHYFWLCRRNDTRHLAHHLLV